MRVVGVVVVSILIAFSAADATANDFSKLDITQALTRGQPEVVAILIERAVGCVYYAGEEPYDAERAAEIVEAVQKLRCNHIDVEIEQFKQKYSGQSSVVQMLEKIQDDAWLAEYYLQGKPLQH